MGVAEGAQIRLEKPAIERLRHVKHLKTCNPQLIPLKLKHNKYMCKYIHTQIVPPNHTDK